MVSSQRIRVHDSFIDAMGNLGKPIAEKIKKQYGLETLQLDHPTLTQLVAKKISGKKDFDFRVQKTSRNTGKLILL